MTKAKNFAEDLPTELMGDEDTPTALTHRTSGALLNPNAGFELDIEGARPPYLTIVHGVGEAAETFNPGDLILQKEYLVCPKGKNLEVIILNIVQYYKQRVSSEDWSAGVRPKTFATKEEAREAGFSVEWGLDGSGPDVSPAMDLTLLIRKPDDVVCGLFGIDIGDGEEYAIAKLSSDKTAYRYLINDIGLIIKTKLARTGVFSAVWNLYTEMSKPSKRGNRTQVIRAKFVEMLEDDVIQSITSVMGTPSNG
jgi:hypothetical protein